MSQLALITGASGGLGLEFARLFAADGFDLVLVARSEDKLKAHADAIRTAWGVNVHVVAADLSEHSGPAYVVDYTEKNDLHVNALVNNAGFGDCSDFANCDVNKQTDMIDLNVRALTELSYWYLKDMLDVQDGKILNVASVAAFEPGPGMAVYFATKAFVLSFSEAIAEELRGTGVSVTALCPGTTNTGFWDAAEAGALSVAREAVMASPEQVAAYGYASMKRGRVVAVPGITNKMMCAGVRFVPRPVLRRIVRVLLKTRP